MSDTSNQGPVPRDGLLGDFREAEQLAKRGLSDVGDLDPDIRRLVEGVSHNLGVLHEAANSVENWLSDFVKGRATTVNPPAAPTESATAPSTPTEPSTEG